MIDKNKVSKISTVINFNKIELTKKFFKEDKNEINDK